MGLENPLHIAVILLVLLLLFGAKRLPELGRSMGSGLRGFKETVSGESPTSESSHTPEHISSVGDPAPATAASSATVTPFPAAEPAVDQSHAA